ncbi:MAG: helix-turn-helix transcriptional regulator [Armatimonadetes bacterium]|nr:helix-turn-helix transcriptional regulator [Armatimonadota bacterium]
MAVDDLLKKMAGGAESPVYQTEKVILDFTERICEIMEDSGTSRAELAERLGRSRPWVTKLLRGDQNMTIATMVGVMLALGYELRLEALPRDRVAAQWQLIEESHPPVIKLFPRAARDISYEFEEELVAAEAGSTADGHTVAA